MKKRIAITIVSILLVLLLVAIIIINKSESNIITLGDGTTIALVVDGKSSSILPTSGGYKADITCTNADGVWKYNTDNGQWEIELSNITETVSCNATFTSLTDDDLVANYIQNLLGNSTTVESGTNAYLVNEGLSSSSDVGIRYEGANPDNYVWFNNEMWRIVGVMPTVTDSGTENLVKIIKDDSIGAYSYDGEEENFTWGDNTLYTLLNDYYWEASDGTGTDYCIGNYATALPNCDFEIKGIDSSSYYGNMVEYVYWNAGEYDYDASEHTPAIVYANEIATQIVGGYVGIMYVSDYGYAYYSTDHSTEVGDYCSPSIISLNWLFNGNDTWTMTVSDWLSFYITIEGCVFEDIVEESRAVSPVLYLKSNVYIADGTGSESDPYILGTM